MSRHQRPSPAKTGLIEFLLGLRAPMSRPNQIGAGKPTIFSLHRRASRSKYSPGATAIKTKKLRNREAAP